jgi:tRNA G18 (ribose-2'-O)-methylase SpoU
MPIERIDGPDDPRAAAFREVPDSERLRSQGLFVAEGRLVVRRVFEDPRYRVRAVLVNEASRRELALVFETSAADVPIFVGDSRAFLGLTGHDLHRGCLALVERPPALTPLDVLATSVPGATVPSPGTEVVAGGTVVILEGVSNADNVGGVFRNAAAFGAGGVLLSPTCCDPLYRKAIRTSVGAALRVPFARLEDWPAALTDVRRAGFTIAALTPQEPSETLEVFAARPRPSRIALVAGTEGAGLTPAAEAAADHRVRIAIDESIDSLNVAVAVGIALYALSRR